MMAGHEPVCATRRQFRLHDPAFSRDQLASRMEWATARFARCGWNIIVRCCEVAALSRIERRRRAHQQLGVGMQSAAAKISFALGAISTMRPRYITATRCEMCSTTPRSCEMKR